MTDRIETDTIQFPPLSNTSSQSGASMGRSDTKGEYDLPQQFTIQKMAWVDGDYDTGGAYWGQTANENIYRCLAYDTADGGTIEHFKRAKSHQRAFAQLIEEYPLATFVIAPDELDTTEPEGEMFWFTSGCGRVEFQMTIADAESMAHRGSCDSDVATGRQKAYLASQLANINPEDLRLALKEYGSWDAEELTDHESNLDRILWLAAGEIVDTVKEKLDGLLLGGPGHDGYAYNADVLCIRCGKETIRELFADGEYRDGDSGDTDVHPQPIFFGESPDCEQHCANCGEYLYGESEESEESED